MATHSTGKNRNRRQKLKTKYSKVREDAQTHGIIETTPEGAVRPEVVAPTAQSTQSFPALIGVAIRRGWAVPEMKKPGLVDELIELVEDPEAKAMAKVFAFNALVKGDQVQHEKDQEYIRIDLVLAMWKGVLEAIRNHVQDLALVKLIVADVLRFLPAPSVKLEASTVGGVEGHAE